MSGENALLVKTEAWWIVKKERADTCRLFRNHAEALRVGLALARQWGGKLIVQDEDGVSSGLQMSPQPT